MTRLSENEFGDTIRRLRTEKKITLRKFAEMVQLSPTFISLLERGDVDAPKENKVREIAKVLGQEEDEFVALAGRVSEAWKKVIREHPREMADFLRTAKNLSKDDFVKLTEEAARLSQKSGKRD